jgi:hypothetical protein
MCSANPFATEFLISRSIAVLLTRKKNKPCLFFKGKYLEEYMVLNMKMGNGKVGRIEN